MENNVSDMTTRNNPNSASVIYLTNIKVAQCRMLAENRRGKQQAKKEAAKNAAARKACLQQNRSGAFNKIKNCMDNILSPYEYTMLVAHVFLSNNTLKDAFFHLGGKLGDLPNQIRQTVSTDIIRHLNV